MAQGRLFCASKFFENLEAFSMLSLLPFYQPRNAS